MFLTLLCPSSTEHWVDWAYEGIQRLREIQKPTDTLLTPIAKAFYKVWDSRNLLFIQGEEFVVLIMIFLSFSLSPSFLPLFATQCICLLINDQIVKASNALHEELLLEGVKADECSK